MNAIAPLPETSVAIARAVIAPSPFQKPRVSARGNLDELAASIREVGIIEPPIVRPAPRGVHAKGIAYELVAGHRRIAAAELAGLQDVTCIVREYTDDQVLETQMVENSQRADIHPLDEADNFAELVKRGRTAAQIADKIGRSTAYVVQRLALCNLSAESRKALDEDRITLALALLLARIPDKKLQAQALEEVDENSHGEIVTAKRGGEIIRERYMLRLADAPFDTSSAELVAAAGACSVCPKRSGNQTELFADVDSPDVCTDPTCYRGKLDAHFKLISAAAAKTGHKVLPAKQAKNVFSKYGGINYGKLQSLDEDVWDGNRHVKARKLVKDSKVEVVLAQNPHTGTIHELVPRAALDRVVASQRKESSAKSKSSSRGGSKEPAVSKEEKARRAREALKADVKKRAEELTIAAIAERIEKLGDKADSVVFDVVLVELSMNLYEGIERATARRGIEPKKMSPIEIEKAVLKWKSEATLPQIRSFIVEAMISEGTYGVGERRIAELCKELGVDRKAIEKEADASLKAERAKPAAEDEDAPAPKGSKKSGAKKASKPSKKKAKR
jgi:ParB/RepB/Spo0J family partition protein